MIGLGSLVRAFFFPVLPTPPLSAGPGVVPFARLFAFLLPSCRLPTPPLSTGPWSG